MFSSDSLGSWSAAQKLFPLKRETKPEHFYLTSEEEQVVFPCLLYEKMRGRNQDHNLS